MDAPNFDTATEDELEAYKEGLIAQIDEVRSQAQAVEAAIAAKRTMALATAALEAAGVSGAVTLSPAPATLESIMSTPGE